MNICIQNLTTWFGVKRLYQALLLQPDEKNTSIKFSGLWHHNYLFLHYCISFSGTCRLGSFYYCLGWKLHRRKSTLCHGSNINFIKHGDALCDLIVWQNHQAQHQPENFKRGSMVYVSVVPFKYSREFVSKKFIRDLYFHSNNIYSGNFLFKNSCFWAFVNAGFNTPCSSAQSLFFNFLYIYKYLRWQ